MSLSESLQPETEAPFDTSLLYPKARQWSLCGKLAFYCALPLLLCLYLSAVPVFILLFIALGICTGIAPIWEYLHSSKEAAWQNRKEFIEKYPEFIEIKIPGGVNSASKGNKYTVCARVGIPTTYNGCPPIIFPNGLMATLFTFCKFQDLFTEAGYYSIVFDRLGVGLSDDFPDTSDEHTCAASAFDVANEMNFVMNYIADNNKFGWTRETKWIAAGFSMGSIVTQAFMSIYPDRLCGFYNSDGFPHGLSVTNGKQFENAKLSWNMFTSIHWTGIPRMIMSMTAGAMIKEIMEHPKYSNELMLSFWVSKKCYQATKLENMTMMSCCDLVNAAWGVLAGPVIEKEDPKLFYLICRYPPREAVDVDERKSVKKERQIIPLSSSESRSVSELGSDWCNAEEKEEAVKRLKQRANSSFSMDEYVKSTYQMNRHPVDRPSNRVGGIDVDTKIHYLAPQFEKIVFRSFASRMFPGGAMDETPMGEFVYTQRCRNMQAHEQTIQSLLSKDGARIIYPKVNHGNSLHPGEMVRYVGEILALVGACGNSNNQL